MKVQIKGFVIYDTEGIFGHYRIQPYEITDETRATVCPCTVEVEIPDNYDPRKDLIAALKAKEQKARAAYEAMVTDIHRQISQYEAISMEAPS